MLVKGSPGTYKGDAKQTTIKLCAYFMEYTVPRSHLWDAVETIQQEYGATWYTRRPPVASVILVFVLQK